MLNESVLVIGASENPNRASFSAMKLLFNRGMKMYTVGNDVTSVEKVDVKNYSSQVKKADIVTIFINAKKQRKYYEYILSLKPKKIIFNPGTENPEFEYMIQKQNIKVIKGCTIAMLINGMW